ncbi:protein of unknown function [Taphrina deformans PYCC 5710]|uniref:DNA polymerase delta subunit 3 n=1 Tax=Taphrina deformans (strain PYCC 5710 / ATCC 11124 / CBS 356.35 / IMI 108563 / JCM 9778 / NBRC 8474) TaxID=1097556 RepID=R4XBA9_TAPDE|nr:protein of unknown function [Taphrina deformans PYCC 5710]|eukprot:CCG83129.1 protein of unknown function [Taphrina deformans PYCC 5710]
MSLEQTCMDILDAWVLVDNRIVTYKLLSRLMRIRAADAASLMAQWHKSQENSHATYVLAVSNPVGIENAPTVSTTKGSTTSSNPSHTSAVPELSSANSTQTAVRLVSQDDLDRVKAQYETVLGLADVNMLTSCNVDIQEAMAGQSSKIANLSKTYGIIFNAQVDELNNDPKAHQKSAPQLRPIVKEPLNEEQSNDKVVPTIVSATGTAYQVLQDAKMAPAVAPIPVMKRSASSNLASAFAKTPKPKVKPTIKDHTKPDVKSKLKHEAESLDSTTNVNLPKTSTSKQDTTKAELEAMMMEEDEVISTKGNATSKVVPVTKTKDDEDMLEAEDWSASDTEMREVEIPQSVAVSVRPRGRKKVKKQVHTKDAKGYMVTREEWEWVSCDEEEIPVPSLARQSSTASTKSKATTKKKITSGGIASYFTKK